MKLLNGVSKPPVGSLLVVSMTNKLESPLQLNSSWKPLIDDCRIQAGYCLDAPDRLPGGGCINKVSHLKGTWEQNHPKMIVVDRDE